MSEFSLNQPWQGVMKKHAKSFHLASLLFPKKIFHKVKAFYALCRWIDDAADESPSLQESKENLQIILSDLNRDTPRLEPNKIYRQNNLDPGYVEDLIEGAKNDLDIVHIQTKGQLIQYCYKVAGTVGLAMSDLMSVGDEKARAFAVDLGIAMQITNICRDVREDAEKGRVYLPQELLDKYDIEYKQLLRLKVDDESISLATAELLKVADEYYTSAQQAYIKIPWRLRGAVIVASRLYRSIGDKLLSNQNGNPLQGRIYLNKGEKLRHVVAGLGQWASSSFQRKLPAHKSRLHDSLQHWKAMRRFPS